jgi:hypothetical protein
MTSDVGPIDEEPMDDGPIDVEPIDEGSLAYWFEQSLLYFFDHSRAEHMVWAVSSNMGCTAGECVRYATIDTVDHFSINVLNWTEQQIIASIDNYLSG